MLKGQTPRHLAVACQVNHRKSLTHYLLLSHTNDLRLEQPILIPQSADLFCTVWNYSGDPRSLPFLIARLKTHVVRGSELVSARPSPLIHLRLIYAVLVSVVLAVDLHIAQYFFGVGAGHL